ncbi:hypothetical protein XPN_3935 [Xanthomonas arboricola pv. pruni MAFF 301427]|nr:hypothetical protein XPN_3935 [Xanthomonas arboricola pv. pruni MAFF 301427]
MRGDAVIGAYLDSVVNWMRQKPDLAGVDVDSLLRPGEGTLQGRMRVRPKPRALEQRMGFAPYPHPNPSPEGRGAHIRCRAVLPDALQSRSMDLPATDVWDTAPSSPS